MLVSRQKERINSVNANIANTAIHNPVLLMGWSQKEFLNRFAESIHK
jgi:hypothetical protein